VRDVPKTMNVTTEVQHAFPEVSPNVYLPEKINK
jgi:hypothetical protein